MQQQPEQPTTPRSAVSVRTQQSSVTQRISDHVEANISQWISSLALGSIIAAYHEENAQQLRYSLTDAEAIAYSAVTDLQHTLLTSEIATMQVAALATFEVERVAYEADESHRKTEGRWRQTHRVLLRTSTPSKKSASSQTRSM